MVFSSYFRTVVGRCLPLLLALLAVTGVLCAASCSREEPIKLGFVGGLSGRVADLGIAGRNGAVLAVEESNAAGGVGGRAVKLIVEDDEQDVETARRAMKTLIAQGVVAVIGHMTSAMSTATVSLADEAGVLMLSPTTTTEYLTGKDDFFFRVTADTKPYGRKMADYVFNGRDISTVAVVYDLKNKAYTESWYQSFRERFESLGGRVARVETFSSTPDVHLLKVVRRALVPEAQGLVIIASALDAALLCQQTRKIGSTVPIFISEWAATEKILEMGGEAVEGVVVSQFFDRFSTVSRYVAFRDSYRGRFGTDPGFASVNAYDAVKVALDAVGQAHGDETLKETVLRIGEFSGVQGPVRIDRFGDAARETFLSRIQGGAFVPVK